MNWKETTPLPDGDFGAAILVNRGLTRNPAVCLQASNLIGVDVDGADGHVLARQLVPEGFPSTVAVRSGRHDGGLHLWYRAPTINSKFKLQLASSVTLISDGYLICPPALHVTAERLYTFLPGHDPWKHPITVFPDWLVMRFSTYARQADLEARADDHSPITEGGRHAHLLRVAGAMRRAGAGEPAIYVALASENERRCHPPKSSRDVRALARDVASRYPVEA